MASLRRSELINAWDQLFQWLYLFSVLFFFDIQAHAQTTTYHWAFVHRIFSMLLAMPHVETQGLQKKNNNLNKELKQEAFSVDHCALMNFLFQMT